MAESRANEKSNCHSDAFHHFQKGSLVCFQNLIMEENGSFQVRAEGSTRAIRRCSPQARAVPKPFENTL